MAYQDDSLLELFPSYRFRDYDGLEPIYDEMGQPLVAGWVMEAARGMESDKWITRIIADAQYGNKPIIEFYDGNDSREKPFVSSYFVETLEEGGPYRGIDLDGGVPQWKIEQDDFYAIWQWMDQVAPKY